MTGWQLMFLAYLIPGVLSPTFQSAELKPYATTEDCNAEGKRQTDNQTIPKGTQRTWACASINFPAKAP